MHILLVLVRKDIANFLRNRTAVSLTFLVPIALIYIFGWVFGLNKRQNEGPRGFPLAVVNESTHPAAQTLIAALKREPSFRVITTYRSADETERPLTAAIAEERIKAGNYRFALVIPADLLPKGKIGLHLVILSDPRNEIETQMVNGLLQKTIFSSVPQLLGQSLQASAKDSIGAERFDQMNRGISTAIATAFGGDAEKIQRDIESGDFVALFSESELPAAGAANPNPTGDLLKQVFNLETKQVVGKQVKSPEATRVIGGQAIMFLLFAVSASSAAFFDEKNAGLFQRLLSAPVHRSQLLWSRFLFAILLGLVQLTTMFVMGQLLYGVEALNHFGGLLVICTAAAAACAAFGMLIAAVSPNAQAASGLSTFFVMIMSATGGAWFPISLMPPFMQTVGKFTLVYWSMEGFSQVLWAGKSLLEILPTLGILLGIAAGAMAIAVWQISRKKIFG
jgi:ABC-2 type transport system permease protein